jgi:hypothetical protein
MVLIGSSPEEPGRRARAPDACSGEAGEELRDEIKDDPRRLATKVTGRSIRLAVTVQETTRERLRQIAGRVRITLGELIERALETYERSGKRE